MKMTSLHGSAAWFKGERLRASSEPISIFKADYCSTSGALCARAAMRGKRRGEPAGGGGYSRSSGSKAARPPKKGSDLRSVLYCAHSNGSSFCRVVVRHNAAAHGWRDASC